jgi:hypothetical protein
LLLRLPGFAAAVAVAVAVAIAVADALRCCLAESRLLLLVPLVALRQLCGGVNSGSSLLASVCRSNFISAMAVLLSAVLSPKKARLAIVFGL